MKKIMRNSWIVLAVVLISSSLSSPAYAYLVPLIGGLGWLVVTLVGGILVAATFIWVHVLKFKDHINRKAKKETSSALQDSKTIENDGKS